MGEKFLDDLIYSVLRSRMDNTQKFNEMVTIDMLVDLLSDVKPILDSEPTVLDLPAGIQVVGDIHGNIDDLLRIFERCGYPPSTKYLFLGDYIDRGNFGVEVLTLLFALKCKYPEHVYLLRGNHETLSVCRAYGFQRECTRKFKNSLFSEFTDIFPSLPICAVIKEKIFCVHGGISPSLRSISQLSKEPKPGDILKGPFIDLLWSDPNDDIEGFQVSHRGTGHLFGANVLKRFLKRSKVELMIRSHEACNDGMAWPLGEDTRCITIFSNSDYCGIGNKAAVIGVPESLELTREVFTVLPAAEKRKRRVLLPTWLLSRLGTTGRVPDESMELDARADEILLPDVYEISV